MNILIPDKFTAGITYEQILDLSDYPAPLWSVTLVARGPAVIDIAALADGATHKLSVGADQTALWTAGLYAYVLRASMDGDVHQIESGTFNIEQNLAAIADVFDPRSHNQRTLDAINAVIEGRASRDQESYKIGNRELKRTPLRDLIELQRVYQHKVAKDNAAARGGNSLIGRTVKGVFR